MNLFMRSFSILLSAAFLSLAPVTAFSADSTASTVDQASTQSSTVTYIQAGTCDELKKCKENPQNNCKPPQDGRDCSTQSNSEGSAGTPASSNPNQSAGQEEPSQQASGGSGGANCSDTSSDPEGTQARNSGTLKNKPGTDVGQADKLGKGKKAACEKINSSFDQRARQAHQTGSQYGLDGTKFQELDKDFQEYAKNREACLNNQASAGNQCLEGLSPNTDQAASGVNNVLGQVGQNASDTCGKFSKAMDLAKAGLSAFSAQCGAAQAGCSSSCSKAASGLKSLKKKAEQAIQQTNCKKVQDDPVKLPMCETQMNLYKQALTDGIAVADQETNASDAESVSGKQKICDQKYPANIGSALQGVMGMLAGMMQGNKCEEETDGTAEQAGTLADKCMAPENASLPECICKANPRTVGCSSAYQSMGANGKNELGGGISDKANVDPSNNSGTLDNNGLGGMEQAARSPSGDGGAGAPAGGGGAGIGSSSVGNGSGAGGGDGAGGKGLNANILGGTGGGGGASGGAWGAGASDKYRQYLPGGAKDPAKALAGQQSWKNEVTGQGGKSNWEKVKDRYRDNRSSLLNHN